MNAVAVPVLVQAGHVACALSIAAIRERMARPRLQELVTQLRAEARALGQLIDNRNTVAARPQAVLLSEGR